MMESTAEKVSAQPLNAEDLRAALRCGQPRCACQRGKQVHCPAHEDGHPSFSVDDEDGRLLVHCHAGCPQEAVIEALRERGVWTGRPPAPALSRLVRREGKTTLTGPLVDVLRFVRRYVGLPSDHAAVASALWVAHCWVSDAFDITPYLLVKSPVKRSAKSLLLKVLALLLPRPWLVFSPSEAVLFRKIARDRPQVLLDESDPLFNGRIEQHEPLRALLNAGFERGASVPRCVGEGSKIGLVDFEVFCPKALAVIGSLPDTIEDRSIVISMKRATPAEQRGLGRFRRREAREEAAPIREALARWAEAALPRLHDARPAIPEELDARAADLWEPLLAVAEEAGDGWAVVAWEAALALSTGADREDGTHRIRLLSDIQSVFDAGGTDRLFTRSLLESLKADEEAPWRTWGKKQDGLTSYGLARLLRPFGIKSSGTIRIGEETAKGYYREGFEDAWARYLPPSPPEAPDPSHPSQPLMNAASGPILDPSRNQPVTDGENDETPLQMRTVTGVTDRPPSGEGGGEVEITLAGVRRVLGPVGVLSVTPTRGRYAGRKIFSPRGWGVASPPEEVRAATRAAVARAGLTPRAITLADVTRILGAVTVEHDGPADTPQESVRRGRA